VLGATLDELGRLRIRSLEEPRELVAGLLADLAEPGPVEGRPSAAGSA